MPPGEVNVFGRRALKRGCGVDAPLPRTARKTCKYTCKIHVRGELHGRVARTRGGETLRELSHPPSLSLSLSSMRRVEEILIYGEGRISRNTFLGRFARREGRVI